MTDESDQPSDEILFRRWAEGDLGAFDRLYARHERPLFGFLSAELRDTAEAEDVLHEAFLAVLRARDTAPVLRSFRAWLFEVARNLCHNRRRTQRRAEAATRVLEHRLGSDTAAPALGASRLPDAEERLDERTRAVLLERAVAALPPALSQVYRLRASGLSYEEVSTLLKVPLGTVKSRMHELVNRLRSEVPT